MGIETEFGVTCTFHGHRRLSPDEVARYLFRRVVSWGRSSNVFLRNGARLYLDVGSHPEYATAECDSLVQLVTHDRAGERVLEDLLVDAEQRLADEGIGGDIYLFKNNTDSAGNSYGCHENYLIVRAGEFSRISDVLLPFLVTRQLICGAGKVLQTPKAATFCLSQRAEHIWEGVSSATTRSRPIINTRDEPHADAEKYRRLHVIVGDSNMCETTTMLKVGTAALVLEMIEAGVPFRDFSLDNPIRAIREVSHDITGRRPVRLAGGRQASALDIQREYYSRAVEHLRHPGVVGCTGARVGGQQDAIPVRDPGDCLGDPARHQGIHSHDRRQVPGHVLLEAPGLEQLDDRRGDVLGLGGLESPGLLDTGVELGVDADRQHLVNLDPGAA